MAAPAQEEPARIALLRVQARGTHPDPLAARQRAEAVVNRLSLHAPGLPPEAVLCLRKLRDPRPGLLRLGPIDLHTALAWERAVAEEVAGQARRAARPAEGTVPADAEAVVFRDRAELLACLASDWLAGDLPYRWWWRNILPRLGEQPAEQAVMGRFLVAPDAIPGALARLDKRGQAAPFAFKLGSAASHALALAVMTVYGLHLLHTLVEYGDAAAPVHANPVPSATAVPVPPPWRGWLDVTLPIEGQLLLGLSLTIQRTEHTARSPHFARQVQRWFQSKNLLVLPEPEHTIRPSPRPATSDGPPASRPSLQDSTVFPTPDEPIQRGEETASASPFEMEDRQYDPLAWDDSEPASSTPFPQNLVPGEALIIFTMYGGLLYLINLGLFLGLYGDFTMPLSPGIDLPIWDFVALVGAELVGETVKIDPLWSLLARLAGREEGEAPGTAYAPPGGLALDDWLAGQMKTIRERLALALGSDELAPFFRADARVRVSTERLDAYFSLDELPIEIRAAGLDRDPYWVPAAGKTIVFHYD